MVRHQRRVWPRWALRRLPGIERHTAFNDWIRVFMARPPARLAAALQIA